MMYVSMSTSLVLVAAFICGKTCTNVSVAIAQRLERQVDSQEGL